MMMYVQVASFATLAQAERFAITGVITPTQNDVALAKYQDGFWDCSSSDDYFRGEPVFVQADTPTKKIIKEYKGPFRRNALVSIFEIENLLHGGDKYFLVAYFLGMGTRLDHSKLTILKKSK